MTSTVRYRPVRRRRWGVLVLTAAALLAAGGAFFGRYVYREIADARRLAATVSELDAHDSHWRLESIEARRAIVPEAENSAAIVAKARSRFRTLDYQFLQDRVNVLDGLQPHLALSDSQERAVIDLLEEFEAAVGPALELVNYPRGRHPIAYAADGVSTPLPHLQDVYNLRAHVLYPLLLAHNHERDGAAAARDLVCLIHVHRSVGDEPFPISQLFRTGAYERPMARGLERLLGQCVLADADLARLQALFAEESAYDPWPMILRGARAGAQEMMAAVRRGAVKVSYVRAMIVNNRRAANAPRPRRTTHDVLRDWLDDHVTPNVDADHSWALQYWTRLLDQTASLPWHERAAVVAALKDEEDAAPLLVQYPLTTVEQVRLFQSAQAGARCALTATAAERHRLAHGAWPRSLDALVPGLLPAVPADPFDGRPLRFRRLPDGVVIYAVGPDGQDDGGALDRTTTPPPQTDIGIRLWDPPHRRQLAPAPQGGTP
jgi:hypothetical protein